MIADLRAYCPVSRKQSPGRSMVLRQYVGSGGCQYGVCVSVCIWYVCMAVFDV